jgi:hypothetical protein
VKNFRGEERGKDMAIMTCENSDPAKDDFRMRYQAFIDDIKDIKTRQWTVTYYLLLLFAAVITFWRSLESLYKCSQLKESLVGISVGVLLIGVFFLHNFHITLQGYRKRLIGEIIFKMSRSFQELELRKKPSLRAYDGFLKDLEFTLIFVAILCLGFFAVTAYLCDYSSIWFLFVWLLGAFAAFFLIHILHLLIRAWMGARDAHPEKPNPTACP